jgi:hypothetical protein
MKFAGIFSDGLAYQYLSKEMECLPIDSNRRFDLRAFASFTPPIASAT